jgi:hypothetical protein
MAGPTQSYMLGYAKNARIRCAPTKSTVLPNRCFISAGLAQARLDRNSQRPDPALGGLPRLLACQHASSSRSAAGVRGASRKMNGR